MNQLNIEVLNDDSDSNNSKQQQYEKMFEEVDRDHKN
jgi:hypothetical protein